jgi:hypothetical protein
MIPVKVLQAPVAIGAMKTIIPLHISSYGKVHVQSCDVLIQ